MKAACERVQKKYALRLKPLTQNNTMAVGENRFTVLTESLIRVEYQEQGYFADEPTQRVICRKFPKVSYRVMEHLVVFGILGFIL